MSNEVTNRIWRLQMSPSMKAVFMCLGDRADAAGFAWPSIPGIGEYTCLSRTAVIEAIKALEASGLIQVERATGRNNRIRICLEVINNPSATRTGTADGLVRETDSHPSATRTPPVREADYTRPADGPEPPITTKQPSGNPKKTSADKPRTNPLAAHGVSDELLADYLVVRKAKRAGPLTATAVAGLAREAEKAGISVLDAVTMCCERGWQSFRAEYVQGKQSVHDRRAAFMAGMTNPGETYRERDARLAAERTAEFAPGIARRARGASFGPSTFIDIDYREGVNEDRITG